MPLFMILIAAITSNDICETSEVSASLITCVHLRITGAPMGSIGLAKLLPLVIRARLSKLDLSHQNLGPDGIRVLIPAIRSHPTLSVLHLNHNQLGNSGAVALAMMLEHPGSKLRSLVIHDNEVSAARILAH